MTSVVMTTVSMSNVLMTAVVMTNTEEPFFFFTDMEGSLTAVWAQLAERLLSKPKDPRFESHRLQIIHASISVNSTVRTEIMKERPNQKRSDN